MAAPCVLILAGLDPSGGAGLLADAEAVREMGARPLCVPTALTVQTRARARDFEPVSPEYLLAAARALLEEEDVRALKLGMLASPAIARAIAQLLEDPRAAQLPRVLDPVLAASSGAPLFRGERDSLAEARAAVASLWRRALVTPNALEAQLLLGLPHAPQAPDALEAAARALVSAGAGAVLIKGGHALGAEAVDVLVERDGLDRNDWCRNEIERNDLHSNDLLTNHWHANEATPAAPTVSRLSAPRLFRATQDGARAPLEARGTGCRFASALAAGLALGRSPLDSARAAKALVARHLAASQG